MCNILLHSCAISIKPFTQPCDFSCEICYHHRDANKLNEWHLKWHFRLCIYNLSSTSNQSWVETIDIENKKEISLKIILVRERNTVRFNGYAFHDFSRGAKRKNEASWKFTSYNALLSFASLSFIWNRPCQPDSHVCNCKLFIVPTTFHFPPAGEEFAFDVDGEMSWNFQFFFFFFSLFANKIW